MPAEVRFEVFAPAILQKCVGGFLLYKFCRIIAGIFLEDFSGHFFPQKWGEKIRRENPRKKSGGSKIKIHEKSVLPKPDPKSLGGELRHLRFEIYDRINLVKCLGKTLPPAKKALQMFRQILGALSAGNSLINLVRRRLLN